MVIQCVAVITGNNQAATFGFLYGAMPTAPTLVIWALQYDMEVRAC